MAANVTRASVLGAGAALALSAIVPRADAANVVYGKPETTNLRVGIPLDATSYLPIYIAAQSTWKDAGLNVQLLAFRGDAEVSQALAGDSIDINCGSLSGLLSLIGAGQEAIGIYGGFNLAGFSWYGQPGMKSWNDVRGKALGVSTFGSTTDALTRYVLRKHGIDPEKDAHLIAVGNTVNQYQALKANRTQVAMISAPVTWQAEADGFPLLGTQQREVAPEWPEHIYSVKTKFLAANKNTIAAMLRGHVAALRKAKADRAMAVAVFVDRLKYTPALAGRAYDELMPTFDERGRLPERSMKVFWDIAKANGDVKAAMPDSAILNREFVDTFASWAPPN
jgi:NitT/TauT family transport system substrate-binding protein